MKQTIFSAIMFAVLALLLEAFSSLVLYRYYAATEESFTPSGLATVFFAEKALKIQSYSVSRSVSPSPLYVADDKLGYTTAPGRYLVSFTVGSKTHSFHLTVVKPGERATSYVTTHQPETVYVFGDSNVLGWGNDDEHSMPWLLQQKFTDYSVVNLAQTGYGITQAAIQIEAIEPALRPDDIIILPYADYYLVRNYGAPSWLKQLSSGLERSVDGEARLSDVRFPSARARADGSLSIEYVPMSCEKNNGYCDRTDPSKAELVEATKAILRHFLSSKAKVVLVFLDGADDDPVVSFAREAGLPIADVRLDKESPEWDDFSPFDLHPGPTAQFNYFRKLSDALVAQNIVSERSH